MNGSCWRLGSSHRLPDSVGIEGRCCQFLQLLQQPQSAADSLGQKPTAAAAECATNNRLRLRPRLQGTPPPHPSGRGVNDVLLSRALNSAALIVTWSQWRSFANLTFPGAAQMKGGARWRRMGSAPRGARRSSRLLVRRDSRLPEQKIAE